MQEYRIPVSSIPQTFNIFLAIKEYRVTIRWNAAPEGGWFLDFATPDKGEPILSGVPIVTGVDILGPYEYLNFGGHIICYSDLSDTAPTLENFGEENELLFVVMDSDSDG